LILSPGSGITYDKKTWPQGPTLKGKKKGLGTNPISAYYHIILQKAYLPEVSVKKNILSSIPW